MPRSLRDYGVVFCVGALYALSYFFRGSIAPITDVLEREFDANSTQIGLMSSLFWLSYCMLQLPIGISIEYMSTERLSITAGLFFCISCTLFGAIESDSVLLPSAFMLLSGVFGSPFWLCFANIVSTKFSNNHLASFGGIMVGFNALILVAGNMAQAYLYQNYAIWRPVYWVLAAVTFIVCLLFILLSMNFWKFRTVGRHSIDYAEYSESEMDQFMDVKLIDSSTRKLSMSDAETKKTSVSQKIIRSLLNKYNWLIAAHQFCMSTGILSFNGLWLISYMSLKYGIDRETSTMISSSFWMSYAVGSVVIGRLGKKYQRRRIFYLVCSFVIFVAVLPIIYGPSDMPLAVIVACNVLSGFANGVSTLAYVLVREYNECLKCKDTASGVVNSLSVSAGFITQFMVGVLMDISWTRRGGDEFYDGEDGVGVDRMYAVSDYNFAFTIFPAVGALSFVLAFCVKETHGVPLTSL